MEGCRRSVYIRGQYAMGNQVSNAQAGLDCCTAIDVGDDDGEPNAAADARSQFGAAGSSQAGRSVVMKKHDRGICRELTGESLFTECLDDRCGSRDRAGRRRPDFYRGGEGLPADYNGTAPLAQSANGAVPIYFGKENDHDPVGYVLVCPCLLCVIV